MGDQDKEKNMENLDVVQKARVVMSHELPKVVSCQRVQVIKRYEIPKVTNTKRYEDQEGRVARSDRLLKPSGLGLRLTQPIGSRPKAGSGKEVRWAIEPDFMGRSNLDSIRLDGLVFGAIRICSCGSYSFMIILTEEKRMVLVKPRSREGSVSERLCNVWLDDVRDELVIVYETIKKLCIGSHVSK
ncbi:hypothetical protein DY000_02014503 [Brassica cretica]|uniref:Uncharacterized protein n=1 Tax=Brassica cretica TaxID=69181 RepID=A0ABQ7D440_BRACR|nr:hypothetical protein DY000_02014503 [Brassica cretica]